MSPKDTELVILKQTNVEFVMLQMQRDNLIRLRTAVFNLAMGFPHICMYISISKNKILGLMVTFKFYFIV
jgi:hypothetical protein